MNRWLSGNLWWPLTERLARRDTMWRYRSLCRSESLSPERLRALQEAKLRRVVALAARHCSFYAERFRSAGLDPADPALGLAALSKLPTLSRAEIRANLEAMTWRECPRGGPVAYTTGGSSGEPLRFYFDRFRQSADWAGRWRGRRWWGLRPGDREVMLWGAPVELKAQDRLRRWRDWLLNQWMLNAFDMTGETMRAYARRLRELRPACVYGYPSSLALLSRFALAEGLGEGGLGSPALKAVFVTGEVLLTPDREAIERAFGAPVAIEYGARDAGLMACACPRGGLHVNAENLIVELLDEAGEPVRPGEVGEVTVTSLESFAMPVIRYRLGDLARQAEGGCGCGLGLPALAEVRGRVTDAIVTRTESGLRRMHALSLIYVVRELEGVEQFRITQRELDVLEVEVVAGAGYTAATEARLVSGLHQRMGAGTRIRVERRPSLRPSASGKHACVVSHVRLDDRL